MGAISSKSTFNCAFGPKYFLASPGLFTKKGTLGSGPTLPPANHLSYSTFNLLDLLTIESKYWFKRTWADKAFVPSTIVLIGFWALPNNFFIISCPTPVRSLKFLPPFIPPFGGFIKSSAIDFTKKSGTLANLTTPDLLPDDNKIPLGSSALFQTSLTIFLATSSDKVTPFSAASFLKFLTASSITAFVGG